MKHLPTTPLAILATITLLGLSNPAATQEKLKDEALLFLIAGDKNAEGQAAFSKESNTAAGHESAWPVIPGSTAAAIGLPVNKEAYPNSFIWNLAKNHFEPLTPGANLLANLRLGGRPAGDPNRHGVELPLAHRLQNQFPGKDVFFVKVAEEGTALHEEWKPGNGVMYTKLIEAYGTAVSDLEKRYASVKVLGLYWDQCEGEHKFQSGIAPMKDYPEHLAAFVKAIRADVQQPALRIFMLKQMFHKTQEAWQPILQSQQEFCQEDPNGVLIDIDFGKHGTNMKAWSSVYNWTSLSSKGFSAVAGRIATEVMLAERAAKKTIDGSPNTQRPALVFLIAGQSNAGGTATLTIAHRKAADYQYVWPSDPETVAENCGVPVTDEAYANCYVAQNKPVFKPIAPASELKAHEAAFASQGTRKREYRHGIELPAAYRLRRQFPDNDIYVIKVVGGGKSLHFHWNPDVRNEFFDLFIRTVPAALRQLAGEYPEVRVVGLYWDQGESDIHQRKGDLYEEIFRKLIARMRSGARLHNLNIFTRKHIFYHQFSDSQVVNQAMANIAAQDPNGYVLDIDLGAKTLDNEPNFNAWSCTFRNIHLSSKAFKQLTGLIFDECIPNARVEDFVLYKQ